MDSEIGAQPGNIHSHLQIHSTPSKPAPQHVSSPLRPCRRADLCYQHCFSRTTTTLILTTLAHNDDWTRQARNVRSASYFELGLWPELAPDPSRHVCHHSSRASHLVQHSARSTHSPCRPSYIALQLVGNMFRSRRHSHTPRRQKGQKQQVVSRRLDHVPRPNPTVRTYGLCAHSAGLWD